MFVTVSLFSRLCVLALLKKLWLFNKLAYKRIEIRRKSNPITQRSPHVLLHGALFIVTLQQLNLLRPMTFMLLKHLISFTVSPRCPPHKDI